MAMTLTAATAVRMIAVFFMLLLHLMKTNVPDAIMFREQHDDPDRFE
jgi:hypothetical protein